VFGQTKSDNLVTNKFHTDVHDDLELWSASRIDLVEGNVDLSIPVENDKVILDAFIALDSFSKQIIEGIHALLEPTSGIQRILDADAVYELLKLADLSSEYLDLMNAITNDYQTISDDRIINLVRVEIIVLCFTAIVLVIEVVFVVIPSVRHASAAYHIHKSKNWMSWSRGALD
jgi:two-component system sensor histidine kinase DegS